MQKIKKSYINLITEAIKIYEEKTTDAEGHSSGCLPCGGCTSTNFNNVIDMSIFKDGLFVMFAVSNLLSNTALNVPYIYTVVCIVLYQYL